MSGGRLRTIGLLGGMSWESTLPYYRLINEAVARRLGGLHSAKVVLYSFDFAEVERLQKADDWEGAARLLADAARGVERAGAECLLICTNTMHRVAPEVEAAIGIPLLHIADATAEVVRAAGIAKVGLLGTRFTMEQPFYVQCLERHYGLEVVVPPAPERELVHRVIFDELCVGRVEESSRRIYREVMVGLVAQGAGGIILGCTEIAMLVGPEDASVPIFDTTTIHAAKAAAWALGEG